MATKKAAEKATSAGKLVSGDVVWVNYNLTDEQRAELKASSFDCDNALLRLCEENYKITVSYDAFAKCFACFLIPKGNEHKHTGMILSGRGSTPIKAIKQTAYIHWNIYDGDWSDYARPTSREIDD